MDKLSQVGDFSSEEVKRKYRKTVIRYPSPLMPLEKLHFLDFASDIRKSPKLELSE